MILFNQSTMLPRDLSWFSEKWTRYKLKNRTKRVAFAIPRTHVGRHGNDHSGTIKFESYAKLYSRDGQYKAYVNDKHVAIGRVHSRRMINTGGRLGYTRYEAAHSYSRWAKDINEIRTCWWQVLRTEFFDDW